MRPVNWGQVQLLSRGRLDDTLPLDSNGQWQAQPERTAPSLFALYFNPPVHQSCERLRNREAKSGTALGSGVGAVGLGKGLEQSLPLLGTQAEARVRHGKFQYGQTVRLLQQIC